MAKNQLNALKAKLFIYLLIGMMLIVGFLLAQAETGQLRGDYNGDGKVGITDVLTLIIRSRSDSPDTNALDYNADGVLSGADAMTLLSNIFWGHQPVTMTVVSPVESDSLLLNPGVGFASPNCTDSDLRIWNPRYPLCSTAYYRWYWDEIEPEEGQIAFNMIDSILTLCHQERQMLGMRVMVQNHRMCVPQWLVDKGLKGQYYNITDKTQGFMPDYSDTLFIQYHTRLIRALGERYDGHPDLHHVDLGSVGSWGEWNVAGAPEGFEMPPDSILHDIVDLYLESFTKTKLVMLIGGAGQMKYAIENGTGWRADCLGDWGMWGSGWYHMRDSYPIEIAEGNAEDAWKTAPVLFEACGTGSDWYYEGMGVVIPDKEVARDTTIAMSLNWHISVMHMVYGHIYGDDFPDEWLEAYDEWAKKMGYRYVLRRFAHSSVVSAGGSLMAEMDWENVGVAPCYYTYPLAFQFRNPDTGDTWEVKTDADITEWLPGEISYNPVVTVPSDIPSGEYELGVALLDPYYGNPRISLAVEGGSEDGWYRLSTVTVR